MQCHSNKPRLKRIASAMHMLPLLMQTLCGHDGIMMNLLRPAPVADGLHALQRVVVQQQVAQQLEWHSDPHSPAAAGQRMLRTPEPGPWDAAGQRLQHLVPLQPAAAVRFLLSPADSPEVHDFRRQLSLQLNFGILHRVL